MNAFSNIIVVVDDHQLKAKQAFLQGLALARSHQAKLSVMTVVAEPGKSIAQYKDIFNPDELLELKLKQARDSLASLVEEFEAGDVDIHVALGKDFIEIIRRVVYERHDLLIKLADEVGEGFDSSDFHLMRKCPVPVYLMRADATNVSSYGAEPEQTHADSRHAGNGESVPKKVLAAIDLSEQYELAGKAFNNEILAVARDLAEHENAQLHVLSCWTLYGETALRNSPFMGISEAELSELLAREQHNYQGLLDALVAEHSGALELKAHLIKGNASEAIPRFVRNFGIDTIVMGTVARSGIPGLLIGNTAETVLSQLACSVVTLKPQGFESLIK